MACRGGATEMGSLASQMRGLALDANDEAPKADTVKTVRRGPVILILDDTLQALPWESLPGLQNQRSGLQLLDSDDPGSC